MSGAYQGKPNAARVMNVQIGPAFGSMVHPASSHASVSTGVMLRRMLSSIFQRDTGASGLTPRPRGPGISDTSHGRSCQSPRSQRCSRRVAVR